jgi:DNA-binding transcriptional MerR regulator
LILRAAPEVETELDKSPDAFRTISEVADDLDIPQHVLRFWETRFPQVKPLKRGGGRRYYRPDDVLLLKGIRRLLYGEGYTIKGVQRILKDQGARSVVMIGQGGELQQNPAAAQAQIALTAELVAPRSPPARTGSDPSFSPHMIAKLKLALAEISEARVRLHDVLHDKNHDQPHLSIEEV